MQQASATNQKLIKPIEGAPSLFAELTHLGNRENYSKGGAEEPFFMISIPVFEETPITRPDGWQEVKPTEENFDVGKLNDAARKFADTVKLKLEKKGYQPSVGMSFARGSLNGSNPPSISDSAMTFMNSGKSDAQVSADVKTTIAETEQEMKHILEAASKPARAVSWP